MSLRIKLWRFAVNAYPAYLRKIYRMDLRGGVKIAYSVHLDKSINPKGIHIGSNTMVLREAMILSHDACRGLKVDTYIGRDCVIGVRSIIMPGVTIGDEVVVGAGSIVTKNIPSNCIVAGNPAHVIREGIHVINGKIQY